LGSLSNVLDTVNVADYTIDMSNNGHYGNTTFNYQQPTMVNASVEHISHATAGTSGLNDSRSVGQYAVDGNLQKGIFSTRMYRLPLSSQYVSTRKKVVSRKAIFAPASSLGFNTRFGSMVLAYMGSAGSQPGDATLYPLVDSLFYDSSGLCMLQHYRLISGIYLTQRGTGVAGCTISIQPGGQGNVFRHAGRRTFQGPLSGYVQQNEWTTNGTYTNRLGNVFSGWNGTGVPAVGGTSGNFHYQNAAYGGCSGWGAVIGVVGDDYNDGTYSYDMGVCEHPTGMITEPTGGNPSVLYWPYVHTGPMAQDVLNQMHVDFSNIVFLSGQGGAGILCPDNVSFTPTQLVASGFCRPTGFIVHYDSIGPVGHRLLPHFAEAVTNPNINTYYPPSIGGGYPGFSLDNGLEVYFDITWSGDCSPGVINCS
jgi:hypothetical protein